MINKNGVNPASGVNVITVTPKFGATKIGLTKMIRAISPLTLKDSKELVESLWTFQYDAIAWIPAMSVVTTPQQPVSFAVDAVRLAEFLLSPQWMSDREQYDIQIVHIPEVIALV